MGLGIGDFNLDGNLDVLKTHFSGDTPALYLNRGKTGFLDTTLRSGLGVETRFVSWGAAIVDLDNDGYLENEAGAAILAAHCSRGLAIGDFDNDGDRDILIVNLNEPPSLLRNDTNRDNHWLKIKLVGVKSNRSAIGAKVIARYGGKIQGQEVLAQSGFLSADDSVCTSVSAGPSRPTWRFAGPADRRSKFRALLAISS
jgi:hypothetical protein